MLGRLALVVLLTCWYCFPGHPSSTHSLWSHLLLLLLLLLPVIFAIFVCGSCRCHMANLECRASGMKLSYHECVSQSVFVSPRYCACLLPSARTNQNIQDKAQWQLVYMLHWPSFVRRLPWCTLKDPATLISKFRGVPTSTRPLKSLESGRRWSQLTFLDATDHWNVSYSTYPRSNRPDVL